MRPSARAFVTLTLGAALVTGLSGCGVIDNIDTSRLPELSRSAAPVESPAPAQTATEDSEPQATVTTESKPAATVTAESKPAATVTAAPEPTPTAQADATGDTAGPWWLWLLGAFVLMIVGALWRQRSVRQEWRQRLAQTKSELSWLESSLIPQVISKPTAAEATAVWQAARPRMLDLDRELHEMADGGPSASGRANSQQGLQSLQVLTAAVDAETSTREVSDADALRARRAAVENARASARAWITPPQR